MITRLTRVSILRAGIFSAVMYGVFAVIMAPFLLLSALIGGGELGLVGAVFILILYPFLGFVGGIVVAVVYNLTARVVGGLELTLEFDAAPGGEGGSVGAERRESP